MLLPLPLPPPLQTLDSVWLKEGPFVAGQVQPSIADLLMACEVEQLSLLDAAAPVGGVGGWVLG